MSDKNNRGSDALKMPLFPLPTAPFCKIPSRMPLPLRCGHISCSGIRLVFIQGPPVHSGSYLLPVTRREKMHCPNCGSPDILQRHVGKKTGGVIGATAGGLAALEGASVGALMGSAVPVVGTLAVRASSSGLLRKEVSRTVTALISSILKTWSVLARVVTRNQFLLWKIRRCGATVSWLRPLTCSVTVR